MKKILFVDDEIQILKALKRLFMDTEYEVFLAESAKEGLELLEAESIDMVVSDMRMPDIDGYEFLSKVKERYPKIIRIILSGYSEEKIVFQALKKNVAKLYMFKPWENEKLLLFIKQMFETEIILSNEKLFTLVNNFEFLPTINTYYKNIIESINEDLDMKAIANEIEKDVSVAAKILQVANSSYYGAKTGSIQQALSYLGLQNVRNIVLSVGVIDIMKEKGVLGKKIEAIWEHSFFANKLTNFLYEKHLKKNIPLICSAAALFHNIGSVFFIKYFFKDFLAILMKGRKEKLAMEILEKGLFGVSHYEIGAYLLRWWEMPYPIIETALYHGNPTDKNVINSEIVCAVHIAVQYAAKLLKMECASQDFCEEAFEVLQVSRKNFEESLNGFKI